MAALQTLVRLHDYGGSLTQAARVARDQTVGQLLVRFDAQFLRSAMPRPVAMRLTVRQTGDDGRRMYPVAGCESNDIVADSGVRHVIPLRWTEQVIHESVWGCYGWDKRRTVVTDTRERYFQLNLLPTAVFTVEMFTYRWLVDGVVVEQSEDVVRLVREAIALKRPRPLIVKQKLADAEARFSVLFRSGDSWPAPVLCGRHSAILLGTLVGATAASAAVTSASRITMAESLITAASVCTGSTGSADSMALTDAFGNTITDQEGTAATDNVRQVLGYHLAGAPSTRGEGHTITSTETGATGTIENTINGLEFLSIAKNPQITQTRVRTSVTPWTLTLNNVAVPSLVVMLSNTNNTSRPPTVTDGTQAIQTSANTRTNTTHSYKTAQQGAAVTMGGTLTDNQPVEHLIWTFEEARNPPSKSVGGVPRPPSYATGMRRP